MQKKLIIHNLPELYRREVIASARAGIPTVNCEGQSIQAYAGAILKDYKTGRGESPGEADNSTQMGIMLACVLELAGNNKLTYFNESMLDNGTVRQLLTDIKILRMEEKLDDLKDSNEAKLKDVYEIALAYIDKLYALKLYDSVRILEECTELISCGSIDVPAEIIAIYRDTYDNLSEKEKKLWKAITAGKAVEVIEISEVNSQESKRDSQKQFFKVFGLHNEIHAVVKDVIARGIPWEQVQVVASSAAGFYPLMTYLQGLGIPYCMPEGISERYSFAASHIEKYLKNPANFILDSEGNVRIRDVFERLAKQLEEIARIPKLMKTSAATLYNKASVCRQSMECYDFNIDYYLATRLVENILLGGSIVEDNKEEGAIYISSLAATEIAFRPYVYLIGFESKKYPPVSMQSPVLLDEERNDIGLPDRYCSTKQSEEIEKHLDRILNSDAKCITFSYVSFDTVNMRELNPSAIYQKELKDSGCKERIFGFAEESVTDILEAREWLLQA